MGDALSLSLAFSEPLAPAASSVLNSQAIVGAFVTQAPEILLTAPRPIQIDAALLSVSENGDVALRTAAGPVVVALAEPAFVSRALLEPLLKAGAGQKTLAVLLHPGDLPRPDAPRAVALLVPKDVARANEKLTEKTAPACAQANEPIAPGKKLALMSVTGKNALPRTDALFSSLKDWTAGAKATAFLMKNLAPFLKNEPCTRQEAACALSFPDASRALNAATVVSVARSACEKWPLRGAPEHLKAIVVRHDSNGTVLSIEGRNFLTREKSGLPIGTKLVLAPAPPETESFPSATQAPPSFQEWPALRELVATLEPEKARAFVATKIPSPKASMAGATLFFLAALRAGRLEEWLGFQPRVESEKTLKEPAKRFLDDVDDGCAPISDKQTGEWKTWPLPVHDGEAFGMLKLHVRDSMDDGPAEAKEERARAKKTRFVVTMDFSRLGPVQLEGLSRPRRLDLVVRSERALPENLVRAIKTDYLRTMDALALEGTIGFQPSRQNWIAMPSASPSRTA